MVLDEPEDGDETWRRFQRGPASSLEEILFEGWRRFHPLAINTDFVDEIRSLYEAARAGSTDASVCVWSVSGGEPLQIIERGDLAALSYGQRTST